MKRLTKKDKYGHFYTDQANCRNIWSPDGKKLEGEYFENKTLAIDGKAIDKLGLLEDIEEELGIDLLEAKYVCDNANMTVGYTRDGKPIYTDYGYIEDFINNLQRALENVK